MTNLERWRYYLKDLESPDLFIDWVFFTMISSTLQRRVWLFDDTFKLFPNMFVMLIGPPACGKSRVIAQMAEIIKAPKLRMFDKVLQKMVPTIPYSADCITQEALTKFIAKDCQRVLEYKNSKDKKVVGSHYSLCFMIEELGVLLRKNTDNIVNMLNQFYDSRDYTYKTKHQGEDKISNICVNIIAGTTPSFIQEAFSDKIISQGFTSRAVLVYEKKPRFLRQFPGISDEQVKVKKEIVEHVNKLSLIAGPVRFSDEALAYHKDLYESGALTEKKINTDYRLDTYYSRKNAHVLKLSTVIHFSHRTDSMVVEKKSIDEALKLLAKTELNMHEAYVTSGRNVLAEITKRVLQYIIDGHNGVKYKKLWLVFINDATKQEIDQCLEFLTVTDQIVCESGIYFARVRKTLPDTHYV